MDKSRKLNLFGSIFSYLFPFLLLLGYFYSTTGSGAGLFTGGIIQSLLIIMGIIVVGTITKKLLLMLCDKMANISFSKAGTDYNYPRYRRISCAIMVCGWLPAIIANLPGAVPYDGMTQLLEHFGRIPHYGHHPVFITRLYGVIAQFGSFLWCDNFGVFLVIVFQTIICAAIFSGVCVYLLRITGSTRLWLIISLFYAIFPIFGSYVSAVMKDTFYMAMGTWFILVLCKLFDKYAKDRRIFEKPSDLAALAIPSALMCLSRKEAYIIVAITLLLIALYFFTDKKGDKKNSRSTICVLAISLVVYFGFNFVVHGLLGVPKGEIAEALSIPFQQTARYVTLYPDEVTAEEREAIDTVLPYDKIPEAYNPELSDPIKGKMRSGVGMKGYMTYALTWFKMGLKKPLLYIDATLNNTYGYFYPPFKCSSVLTGGIEHSQTARWGTEELDIYFLLDGTPVRNVVLGVMSTVTALPVLSIVFNTGFYFWLLIILITYCIQQKEITGLLLLVCPALTYLVCFASPANGYTRYILLVISTIILISVRITLRPFQREQLQQSEAES